MLKSRSPEIVLVCYGVGMATLYGVALAAVLSGWVLRELLYVGALFREAHTLVTGIL